MNKVESAISLLRSKSIRPSIARIKILEYLSHTTEHPTVEMIHTSLLPAIPTLSKATVYKTVGLLVEAGLARLLYGEDCEAHYDADISDHGHFQCTRCGKIYDFAVNLALLETEGLERFAVTERNVFFRGACPRCLSE
ncbi:MAG: transcriptional repressor [Firmicutes bacterium]|nr:transcriptional repressor [Bacillota bacterium]